jgi:hypothetical protein
MPIFFFPNKKAITSFNIFHNILQAQLCNTYPAELGYRKSDEAG